VTFLDTNVLVYAVDKLDVAKQALAMSVVADAIAKPGFMASAQVLNEFSNVALLKLKLMPDEVRQFVGVFNRMKVVPIEPSWTDRALAIKAQYGLQFFDSLLLAAAEANHCDTILTEDLNDGQVYAGVRAVNPFKSVKSV